MSETVAVEIIKTVPAALWVGFAVLVYLTMRHALLPQFGRLTNVKTAGIELRFAEKLMDEAAAQQGAAMQSPASDTRAAISRLDHAADLMAGGRILWVDDNPEWTEPLVRLFRQVGMAVDSIRSTSEALAALRQRSYDLVITDMLRHTEQPAETAGYTLIDALEKQGSELPIIMLTATFDPWRGVHPRLFAYTNRIDELVQYVIDVMERVRFGAFWRPATGIRRHAP